MNQGSYERVRGLAAKRQHGFGLDARGRVLVCVSGGADSVCLLRVLHDLGLSLAVFHLDHGTRGDASARDAAFVEALARRLDLPFHLATRDVPAEAAAANQSLEEAGRHARYEEAAAIAAENGYDAIATAHHAGDQAETVLMRLIRGTGLRGLGGIPPMRALSRDLEIPPSPPFSKGGDDVRGDARPARGPSVPARMSPAHDPIAREDARPPVLIRPLIDCERADIEAALVEIGQDWRHDASNDALSHLRNRLRHELLPLLRAKYNPRIDDALVRLAESARADDALLDGLARDFLAKCSVENGVIERAAFSAGNLALQRRAAGLLLDAWGVEPAFERVEAVRALIGDGGTGAAYEVDGLVVYNNREVTELSRGEAVPLPPVPLAIPGETRIHGRLYRVRLRTPAAIGDPRDYCSPSRQVFDADAFLGDAAVRGREAGDRFRPLGLEGEKKLKDWFIDQGMTRGARTAQHLITVDGNILWIVGHAIDARGAVTASTRRVVEIEVVE